MESARLQRIAGFDFIGAANRLRSLSTVVHGQQPKPEGPLEEPAAGLQSAPAASDDSETAEALVIKVDSPKVGYQHVYMAQGDTSKCRLECTLKDIVM
jgi:hypothetical protein